MRMKDKMKAQCIMKVKYLSETHALKAEARMREGFKKQWAYKCPSCKRYHLTTQDPAVYQAGCKRKAALAKEQFKLKQERMIKSQEREMKNQARVDNTAKKWTEYFGFEETQQ